jgi:hypothetical protein
MPAKHLPTVEQFKKDTYVLLGIRSSDKIISWIDPLLALYQERQTEGFTQPYLLAELPRELEQCFGRKLSGHGEVVDFAYFTKFTGGSGVALVRSSISSALT